MQQRQLRKMSQPLAILLCSALPLFVHGALSSTVVVDGVSEWKDPTVHVGEIVVFRHRHGYDLYIFRNQRAFNLCNFTEASLLTKPASSSYTWHPSRPGFFYFSFSNGSASTCQLPAQKLTVQVTSTSPPPENVVTPPESPPQVAPAPTSGGVVSSSPAFPWPFRPRQELSPSPSPGANSPATEPPLVPDDKGGGIPFINSNPAVPLPTGEVDSATIQPLPTSGHGGQAQAKKQTYSSLDDLLAQADRPVLVDFYATWCGPCQFMVPILNEVSTRLKGKIRVVKIDTEKYPSTANQYAIEALPAFILFKDGKPYDRFEGALTANQLIQRIEESLKVKQ